MDNNFTFNSTSSITCLLNRISRATIAFAISLLLSILLITVWSIEGEAGPLHQLRSASQVVFKPFYELGHNLFQPLRNLSGDAPQYSLTEIENILRENQQSQAALAGAEETLQENERLKALLAMKDTYDFDSVGSRVIAKNFSGGKRTLLIDVGAQANLTLGAPVLSAQGLIGSVSAVYPTSAEVRLLTDITSAVAVYCQDTRLEGILAGSSEGALYLNYISASYKDNVKVGDSVLTSGNGGRFPKGLLVGVISAVDYTKGEFLQITVRPFIYNTNFEEVIVLMTNPETAAIARFASNETGQANGAAGGTD